METIDQLNTLLDNLKIVRERNEEAKTKQSAMLADFQKRDDWEQLSVIRSFASAEIEQLESEIRNTSLALHELCADIPERVTVKMFTVVDEYDEQKAKEWSLSHFTPAIKLDTKIFEKAVKDGNIPAELATTHKEARAQIATKL